MWRVSLFHPTLAFIDPRRPGCDLSSGLEERTARVPAGRFTFPLRLLRELFSAPKAKLLTCGGGRVERLSAFACGGSPGQRG